MSETREIFNAQFTPRPSLAKGVSGVSAGTEKTPAEALSKERTIHDTIELSENGQKIINVARGFDLANEFKKAPVDENFQSNLQKAQEDIFRISRLFGETVKALFAKSR